MSESVVNLVAQVLVTVSLAGFFVVSALAYDFLQLSVRWYRLEQDLGRLRLLGYYAPPTSKKKKQKDEESHNEASYKWSYRLGYLLHVPLTVLVTVVGASLLFMPSVQPGITNLAIGDRTLEALRYGFLGAYVFSLHLVFRRYSTYDLQPSVYLSCALTMLAGMAFNFVAFEAVSGLSPAPTPTTSAEEAAGSVAAAAAPIIAFSLGYFPGLAIRWFDRLAYSALRMRERRSDHLALGLIDGVSVLHEARLRDNGIDCLQNLASVDIRELLEKTTFSAQQVVDWIDQAILFIHLSEGEVDSFRRAGVRVWTDFKKEWHPCRSDPEKETTPEREQRRRERANLLQSTSEKLDMLYDAMERGPNVDYVLNYWKNLETEAGRRSKEVATALSALVRPGLQHLRDLVDGLSMAERLELLSKDTEQIEAIGATLDAFKAATGSDYAPESSENVKILGDMHWVRQRKDEAVVAYRKAIGLDANNAEAHNSLAWAFVHHLDKDDEKALESVQKGVSTARRAIEITAEQGGSPKPDFLRTMASAAEKYIELGERQKAQQTLEDIQSAGYASEDTLDKVKSLLGRVAAAQQPNNT